MSEIEKTVEVKFKSSSEGFEGIYEIQGVLSNIDVLLTSINNKFLSLKEINENFSSLQFSDKTDKINDTQISETVAGLFKMQVEAATVQNKILLALQELINKKSGEVNVKVNVSGAQYELEVFLRKLIGLAQYKAVYEGQEFLVGLPIEVN